MEEHMGYSKWPSGIASRGHEGDFIIQRQDEDFPRIIWYLQPPGGESFPPRWNTDISKAGLWSEDEAMRLVPHLNDRNYKMRRSRNVVSVRAPRSPIGAPLRRAESRESRRL